VPVQILGSLVKNASPELKEMLGNQDWSFGKNDRVARTEKFAARALANPQISQTPADIPESFLRKGVFKKTVNVNISSQRIRVVTPVRTTTRTPIEWVLVDLQRAQSALIYLPAVCGNFPGSRRMALN
jgi:hypothetical protein